MEFYVQIELLQDGRLKIDSKCTLGKRAFDLIDVIKLLDVTSTE